MFPPHAGKIKSDNYAAMGYQHYFQALLNLWFN
jgi:hypothetical protein